MRKQRALILGSHRGRVTRSVCDTQNISLHQNFTCCSAGGMSRRFLRILSNFYILHIDDAAEMETRATSPLRLERFALTPEADAPSTFPTLHSYFNCPRLSPLIVSARRARPRALAWPSKPPGRSSRGCPRRARWRRSCKWSRAPHTRGTPRVARTRPARSPARCECMDRVRAPSP